LDPSSWTGSVLGSKIKGWCFHHQGLKEIGKGMKISAKSQEGLVHGIEYREGPYFRIGVLWHPERLNYLCEEEKKNLLLVKEFYKVCSERKNTPPKL
jgi:putative glutamine amidotransferase